MTRRWRTVISLFVLVPLFIILTIPMNNVSAVGNEVSTPLNLRPSISNSTAIVLTWDTSISTAGTITGYDVYIGSSLAGTSKADNSFKVTGLTSGTPYTFYVIAIDSAGNRSLPSETITLYTGADAFEQNNDASHAFKLIYGARFSGFISTAADIDYFKFSSSTKVTSIMFLISKAVNYKLEVYDSNMTLIQAQEKIDLSFSNQQTRILTFPTAPGSVYYLKVYTPDGVISPQSFMLYLSPAKTEYVYNNRGQLLQYSSSYTYRRNQTELKYDNNGNLIKKINAWQQFTYLDSDITPTTRPTGNFAYSNLGLDMIKRSVGICLDRSMEIGRIELIDSDASTRVVQSNYSLYQSADNITYTPISNWTFNSSIVNNRIVHTFSFSGLNTRYVKIRTSYSDSLPTFVLNIDKDIKVYLNQ
ncbi:fibronectin type III domain-containing protein [Paenibacillus solisilvae]|uniref:Fibronectin type III domain-containing protein n=1 Tax=Paenibacillus solisilvae TaxID=2486751 RepID=A0ABW0W7L6_9BACL